MEKLIALLGLLFFMFLVLAASVEVVLEVFRGILEYIGITWAKGKVSLDDALKLASEFSPNNTELNTKLQAVSSAAEQLKSTTTDKVKILKDIQVKLTAEVSSKMAEQLAGEINAVAADVARDLEASERSRIFILRLLAALLGCFLVWQADFYVFKMLAQAPEAKDYLASLKGLQADWINILVGGLAAAAGSSYWHDQLDKIRNLKAVVQDAKKLTS